MRQAEQRIFRCDRFRRNGVQSGSGDLAAAQGFGKGGAGHKVAAGSVDDECTVLHARLPGCFQIKQIIPNAHAIDQLQFWQRCDQLRIQTVVWLCDQHLRIRAGRCDLRIGTAAAAQLYDLQLLFLLRQKLAAQALCIHEVHRLLGTAFQYPVEWGILVKSPVLVDSPKKSTQERTI